MAPTTNRVRYTPLAAYLNSAVQAARGVNLPTYLAIARTPGPAWKTYDEIVDDLSALTGRTLNRVSIKTYTEDTFGIPNTRYALVNGKQVKMPHAVPDSILDAYTGDLSDYALSTAIDVEAVIGAPGSYAASTDAKAKAEAESNPPA